MNIDFQEILKELEFRIPNGIINLNEEHQVTTLVEILRENGIPDANEIAQRARVIFGYVNEAGTKKKNAAKPKNTPLKPGESPTYPGYYRIGGKYYSKTPGGEITHSSASGTMKPLNKKEKADANAKPKPQKQEPKQLGGIELVGGAEKRKAKKQGGEVETKEMPDFSKSNPNEIYNYIGFKEGTKLLQYKKVEDKEFSKTLNSSRENAFAGEKAGKGGPATTFQEELSCVISEISFKNPNLDRTQAIAKAIASVKNTKFAKNNYDDKQLAILGLKSSAGHEIIGDMQKNPKAYNMAKTQPTGYPKSYALSNMASQDTLHYLTTKLEKAKTTKNNKEIKHYSEELKAFSELATSATGKEGDGDTVFMYKTPDGYDRLLYITNKQTHSDPKLNNTKASRIRYIRENAVAGANIEAVQSIQNIAAGNVSNMNKDATTGMKNIKSDKKLASNIALIPENIANSVYGRDSFKPDKSYKLDVLKNKNIQQYFIDKKWDIKKAKDKQIIEAALNVVGEQGADQISDSTNGTPGKFLSKLGIVYKEIQKKVDSGKSYQDIVNQSKGKNKLFGGNLSAKDIESIYKNPVLKKLSEIESGRGDSMRSVQNQIVTDITDEDIKLYKTQGLSKKEIEEKLKNENGPNVETYVKTFFDGMHWSRHLLGEMDNRIVSSVGNSFSRSQYYRECFTSLTDYKKPINTPEERKRFHNYLTKRIKIRPGSDSVVFTNRSGEERVLGYDTWRTAGAGEKITGTEGEDLIKCIQSKEK